ncbi:TPA: DUF2326 domain-containing protein [Vibrio parahaemolyticus]|nr:DUF2326 domain-containing protein [Vibrio parahaemolyticus]
MFLKELIIEKESEIVRNITFRKGVNLIVDETSSEDKKKSGNNVGKTTTLRLIDYCLGGDGKNIYIDSEFKNKSNAVIESYLRDNNVVVTLVLSEDISDENSNEIKIRRNFLKDRKATILEVNDEPILKKNFLPLLKRLIFKCSAQKPTFRQIIAKNIRDDKNRLVNTVKVLHPTTKAEEYEALYLFWLGIDLDDSARKQKLITKKNLEENLQRRLRKEATLSQVNQSLILVVQTIEELESAKKEFQINENYEAETKRLNFVKAELNRKSTQLSRLSMRRELIEESAAELNSEIANIDAEKIKLLYSEASALIPEIQKTFQDTLKFHNGMIEEKKRYITEEIPSIHSEIEKIKSEMESLLADEKALTNSIIKSGKVEDLHDIIRKLNEVYENKGILEEQKRLWEKSNKELSDIEEELNQIDEGISSLDDRIQEKVAEFNAEFSKMSDILYGEKFVLSADNLDRGYELNITSLFSNPGTGRKKGEMAAFDLSYIKFADTHGINCLHFILQDQIENTHDNQVSSLLTDVVNNTNCQYVLPVLRDRLPKDIDISDFEILSLSHDNKLFKVK